MTGSRFLLLLFTPLLFLHAINDYIIIAVVRRLRNLRNPNIPSNIDEPRAGPGMIAGGCALLECHLQSDRAQSGTLMHDQRAVARDRDHIDIDIFFITEKGNAAAQFMKMISR